MTEALDDDIPDSPQPVTSYGDRATRAVKTVLTEIGQILGSFRGKFVVIGGVIPLLSLDNDDMRHIGTIDIDLCLNPESLADKQYASLIQSLLDQDFRQSNSLGKFQLVRSVQLDDGEHAIEVLVDFLIPDDVRPKKNRPPLIEDFVAIKGSGVRVALSYNELIEVQGSMPEGGINRVHIAVATIPALLVMKGHAIENRLKQKDAYDIYYSIRNFPGGVRALAQSCVPLMQDAGVVEAFEFIDGKFESVDSLGPTSVMQFAMSQEILHERSAEQWRQDAFGQVDAWLKSIGIRS